PAAPTETLPQKVTRAEIERWSDPSTPASPAERATAWALYRSGVAEADAQLGELLDALAECGHFEGALVAVVGDHGEAFGDRGAVRLELRRWLPAGGTQPLDDPAAAARLDAALERAWSRFVAEELTPAEARRR